MSLSETERTCFEELKNYSKTAKTVYNHLDFRVYRLNT